MNRSFSKIRHIQEANILLEKRLISEAPEMGEEAIKSALDKIASLITNQDKESFMACLKKGNYPNLSKLVSHSWATALTLVMFVGGYPFIGITWTIEKLMYWILAAIASVGTLQQSPAGFYSDLDILKTINKDDLLKECKQILNCFKPSWFDSISF